MAISGMMAADEIGGRISMGLLVSGGGGVSENYTHSAIKTKLCRPCDFSMQGQLTCTSRLAKSHLPTRVMRMKTKAPLL